MLFLTRQTPVRLASLELLGLNVGGAQTFFRSTIMKLLCNSKHLSDFILLKNVFDSSWTDVHVRDEILTQRGTNIVLKHLEIMKREVVYETQIIMLWNFNQSMMEMRSIIVKKEKSEYCRGNTCYTWGNSYSKKLQKKYNTCLWNIGALALNSTYHMRTKMRLVRRGYYLRH